MVQNRRMSDTAGEPLPARAATERALKAPRSASAQPLYQQVVQTLRDEIVKGVYPVGTQLPTEDELTGKFAVSRHTVREALRHLRADGLVSSRQGSGTTVLPPAPDTSFNVHRVASIDELVAYAAENRFDVARREMVTSESAHAGELVLPAGRQWLHLEGYRYSVETALPICWTEVFIAAEFSGAERMLGHRRGPIWQMIEDMYGERCAEVEQVLRVRTLTDEHAKGLHVEPGASAVEVSRIYKTTSDKISEVAVNLYPAEKFRFSMKLHRA